MLHEKRHNKEIVKVKCDLCHELVREAYMKKHQKAHKFQRQFCDICKKVLKSTAALEYHEASHTKRERPFKCSICDFETHSSGVLKEHIIIHTTEAPYACPFDDCNRRYNNAGSLSKHKRKHKIDLSKIQCAYSIIARQKTKNLSRRAFVQICLYFAH